MIKIGEGIMMRSRCINRKRPLILMLVVGAFMLIYYYFWHEHTPNYLVDRLQYLPKVNRNQRKRNVNEKLSINFQKKSVMNFPKWFRNDDWGLKENVSLQNVTVECRGLDKEEETAWNNFFFGTTEGLILELGAMAGKRFSVSAFFENKANWRTILIEGNPLLASNLPIHRPNSLNFNYVICDEPRVVHYIKKSRGADGIAELMSEKYLKRRHAQFIGVDGKLDMEKLESSKQAIKLECIPLTQILLSFKINHINFFILDVEGGEFNVLKTIDFDKITFDVISVETDRGSDYETPENTKNNVDAVTELLTSKGYMLWTRKLGRNSWFVSPKFQPFRKI